MPFGQLNFDNYQTSLLKFNSTVAFWTQGALELLPPPRTTPNPTLSPFYPVTPHRPLSPSPLALHLAPPPSPLPTSSPPYHPHASPPRSTVGLTATTMEPNGLEETPSSTYFPIRSSVVDPRALSSSMAPHVGNYDVYPDAPSYAALYPSGSIGVVDLHDNTDGFSHIHSY